MSVADLAAVAAAVLAGAGLIGPARATYARTIGRRFDLYRRFERLGVGGSQSFFEAVIGEAPTIRRTVSMPLPDYEQTDDETGETPTVDSQFTESLWVDSLFYAQTVADPDGTVLGFSITTRNRRFAPRFGAPRPVPTRAWLVARLTRRPLPALAHVRLGRTRLSEAPTDWDGLPSVRCVIGARMWSYSEAWFFGNPGYYAEYVCTASSLSPIGGYLTAIEHLDWPENRSDPDEGYRPTAEDEDPALAEWIERAREKAVVTTWSVIAFPLSPTRWPPENFGPHGDEVRTLA